MITPGMGDAQLRRPRSPVMQDEELVVSLRNIPYEAGVTEVEGVMRHVGVPPEGVLRVSIPPGEGSRFQSRGFGFLHFSNAAAMAEAVHLLHGFEMHGRPLIATKADRGPGGGRGGFLGGARGADNAGPGSGFIQREPDLVRREPGLMRPEPGFGRGGPRYGVPRVLSNEEKGSLGPRRLDVVGGPLRQRPRVDGERFGGGGRAIELQESRERPMQHGKGWNENGNGRRNGRGIDESGMRGGLRATRLGGTEEFGGDGPLVDERERRTWRGPEGRDLDVRVGAQIRNGNDRISRVSRESDFMERSGRQDVMVKMRTPGDERDRRMSRDPESWEGEANGRATSRDGEARALRRLGESEHDLPFRGDRESGREMRRSKSFDREPVPPLVPPHVPKYEEPSDAGMPGVKERWRMYLLKDGQLVDNDELIIYLGKKRCWRIGRENSTMHIVMPHETCSIEHAVVQHRRKLDWKTKQMAVRPYFLDLQSKCGSFYNTERADPLRWIEIRNGDKVRFGTSSREFMFIDEKELDPRLV